MSNTTYGYLDLPSDPKELTRALVLQIFEHPEIIVQEYARLTTHSNPATASCDGLAKAQAHGA